MISSYPSRSLYVTYIGWLDVGFDGWSPDSIPLDGETIFVPKSPGVVLDDIPIASKHDCLSPLLFLHGYSSQKYRDDRFNRSLLALALGGMDVFARDIGR